MMYIRRTCWAKWTVRMIAAGILVVSIAVALAQSSPAPAAVGKAQPYPILMRELAAEQLGGAQKTESTLNIINDLDFFIAKDLI